MSAHSAGPWRYGITCGSKRTVELDYDPKNFNDNPAIYAADGSIVVGNEEYHVFDEPNRVANVRLILAAPDLLAALQGTLAEALNWLYDARGMDGAEEPWVIAARAAIAKATGAQP